jgi:hypothetical protein
MFARSGTQSLSSASVVQESPRRDEDTGYESKTESQSFLDVSRLFHRSDESSSSVLRGEASKSLETRIERENHRKKARDAIMQVLLNCKGEARISLPALQSHYYNVNINVRIASFDTGAGFTRN